METKPIPREALQQFLRKSDAIAWRMLALNWALIAAAFALVMAWPGWISGAVALVVLGGRQLGLGILTHECAHRSFLSSRAQGEWVGQWLCGAPVFVDLAIYRGYHMTHHVKTGSEDDPDLANCAAYPVRRASLMRKFGRASAASAMPPSTARCPARAAPTSGATRAPSRPAGGSA